MEYHQPHERIDLGGGDYAVMAKDLKHKTSRLVQSVQRKYIKPAASKVLLSELKPGQGLYNDAELDLSAYDPTEANHIMILNQVLEWSLGPITEDTLENISQKKYELLVAEVDRLYGSPLPAKT